MNSKKIERNLSGSEIVNRLRKGHMVRRSCWIDDFYIRITNEVGFDVHGNAILQEGTAIYTHATNGFFMHFCSSSQPFKVKHFPRSGEGIEMVWADDWEDHGFIASAVFDELVLSLKEKIRKLERESMYVKESG